MGVQPNVAVLLVLSLVAFAAAGGCTTPPCNYSAPYLDHRKAVYVAIPKDYSSPYPAGKNDSYTDSISGRFVAESVAAAFSRRADRVLPANRQGESPDEALIAGKTIGADYIVVPSVDKWIDVKQRLSPSSSTVSITLTLTDTANGRQMTSEHIYREGPPGYSFRITTAESLLADALSEYVRVLYRRKGERCSAG